ncbi:hypothetical protein F4778DRAFT_740905 [Xylariomycetidae sp. FL2044]|nr:hypothetical protein F4778DRAFT_740905 [Xylariomycetidae sp. FL2044]
MKCITALLKPLALVLATSQAARMPPRPTPPPDAIKSIINSHSNSNVDINMNTGNSSTDASPPSISMLEIILALANITSIPGTPPGTRLPLPPLRRRHYYHQVSSHAEEDAARKRPGFIPELKEDPLFSYFDLANADYFTNSTTNSTTTATIKRGTLYAPNDRVPLDRLPDCYRRCIDDNCCNMYLGGPHDVRQMTVDEFCRTKWFYVGNWLFDHLQWCVGPVCRSCRPGCREASDRWMKEVCGNPW